MKTSFNQLTTLFSSIVLVVLFLGSPLAPSCLASAAGKEFNEADAELNTVYQSVLSTLADPQQRTQFIAAQRAWIKFRDDSVAFFAAHYPYSKGGLFYNTHLVRERTAFLKLLLATPPGKDPEGLNPSGYLQ